MKTTLEIPDLLFRKAKSKAAERGQTLKQSSPKRCRRSSPSTRTTLAPASPDGCKGFGKLRRLRKETRRIQARIDERFEVIEPEDRV